MGDMSDWYLEMADAYDWNPSSRFACKFCGEPGLSWVEVRIGIWRPVKGGRVHECKRVAKSAAADVADLV